MHSRFDDEQLDQFFQRLNQPLKRLPTEARAEILTEVRQHLDGLAAAHEELGSPPEDALDLALRQFGDPGRVGRHLFREWVRDFWRKEEPRQVYWEMRAINLTWLCWLIPCYLYGEQVAFLPLEIVLAAIAAVILSGWFVGHQGGHAALRTFFRGMAGICVGVPLLCFLSSMAFHLRGLAFHAPSNPWHCVLGMLSLLPVGYLSAFIAAEKHHWATIPRWLFYV